jgi:tyrosyl-tRNA synthetase
VTQISEQLREIQRGADVLINKTRQFHRHAVACVLERDDCRKRFETNRGIAKYEFAYPIVKAGDRPADARL